MNYLFFCSELRNVGLRGAGDAYVYLAYVGMGWALSRLPGAISRYLQTLNPADKLFVI